MSAPAGTVRVAAAAWPIEAPADEAAWAARLGRWFESAVAGGARLLVFPEYGAMELAALAGPAAAGDLAASLDAVADRLAFADEVHEALCREHGVHAAAASGPCRADGGPDDGAGGGRAGGTRFVNRVRLFGPDGPIGHQDKIVMTRFERESWGVTGGTDGLAAFDTAVGRLGVLTCYDAEFPLLGPAVDENRGAAGAFGPPDIGFPEDGVLASGELNVPGWTFADVDLAAIMRAREDGAVLNVRHRSDIDSRSLRVTEVTHR